MHGAIKQHLRDAAVAVFVAALSPCLVTPAAAQQPTQAQQNAIRQSCRADYQAHCSGVPTGGAPALACLQQHAAQLSPACGNAVAAIGAPGNNAPGNNAPANMGTQAPPPPASAAPSMSPRQEMALMRGYCGADYRRYCHGVRPGGGRALQCLQANAPSLSTGCRRALSQAAR